MRRAHHHPETSPNIPTQARHRTHRDYPEVDGIDTDGVETRVECGSQHGAGAPCVTTDHCGTVAALACGPGQVERELRGDLGIGPAANTIGAEQPGVAARHGEIPAPKAAEITAS